MDLTNKIELEQYFADHFDTIFFPMLADLYKKEGDFGRARKVCEIGLEYHPNNVEGAFVLAEIYQIEGNLTEAERFYKNVLSIEPLHYRAAVNLVKIETELKRSPESIGKLWRKIARINPTHSEAIAFLKPTGNDSQISSVEKVVRSEQNLNIKKQQSQKPTQGTPAKRVQEKVNTTASPTKNLNTQKTPEPEKILSPKPPTIKPQKISEEELQALDITPRMATFTMVNVLKKQRLYQQAMIVLKMLEEKGADKALINQERQTLQELLDKSQTK